MDTSVLEAAIHSMTRYTKLASDMASRLNSTSSPKLELAESIYKASIVSFKNGVPIYNLNGDVIRVGATTQDLGVA